MSKDTDSLGNRMKGYESISREFLMKRTPVIIRLDGKAFHTYTRGFKKPFDDHLARAMVYTAQTLLKEIQGAKLAYTQSDEISLLLTDFETFETQAWFDYEVQKIVSVSSSIATAAFNTFMRTPFEGKLALFDSRCFNLTKEEVANYFYWRQQDAIRNSVASVAQANFSHKELQHKNRTDMKNMLYLVKGIDYDKDIPLYYQRGVCVFAKDETIDTEIPIFKNEGRNYIERFLNVEED